MMALTICLPPTMPCISSNEGSIQRGGSWHAAQPGRLPLRLRSYETDRIIGPALCNALAACSSLTQLTLQLPNNVRCRSYGWLWVVTTLRRLSVWGHGDGLPACFAAAVAPLCQLTQLHTVKLPPSVSL